MTMGVTTTAVDGDSESAALLVSPNPDKIPRDTFHLAYIIYFTLGTGYLLPWNAFITAVDYFSFLYPDASVDRVFAVVYMMVGLLSVLVIIAFAHKSESVVRINAGYALFLAALVVVPLMDVWYVKGRVGVYGAYYVTVGVVGLCGVADGLVQGGVVGNAGELPERYMQAVVAGTAASGVLVSVLRVLTKAVYPQDANGLRQSANLYFIVSIVVMILNIFFYNIVHKLPIIKYYSDAKVAISASFGRLLFLPLFYGCLHGPKIFRTEIPVTILTCLLCLTNGYFTCILMILAPKTVPLQHAETAGIVLVLYLIVGLAVGSVLSWFWVL